MLLNFQENVNYVKLVFNNDIILFKRELEIKMKKLFILFVLFVLLWDSFGFANDGKVYFNKSQNAYKNSNYQKAAELSKKSCDMRYAKGCSGLGLLYYKGLGSKAKLL